MRRLHHLTFIPLDSVGLSSMPSSPERPDASRSSFSRHLFSDAGATLTILRALADAELALVLPLATSNPAVGPQHFIFSTGTPFTTDPAVLQTHVQPYPYLAMAIPTNVQDSCTAVVWDELRMSDIWSHVRTMFQTAAGGVTHLASRPECSPDLRASRPSAFREVAISCQMDTHIRPPGLSYRGDAFCLNTSGEDSISLKLRRPGAGVAKLLDAHG